jgi:hypothetical protein
MIKLSGEMGEKCRTHGRDEKCIQSSDRNTMKGRSHLEDQNVDGRIILKWI